MTDFSTPRGGPASRAPARRRSGATFLAALGGALLVLGAGCNPYPQTIFEPTSEFADQLDFLFKIILWTAAVVFVVVEGVLIFAAIRYRARAGDALPRQIHGDARLELAWTIMPAVVLAVILVPSTRTIFDTQAPAPADSFPIKVIGHQFWWEFQYPTLGLTTANEIHMPVGKTISIEQTSADVIHSFWIPALGGKRDVLPGRSNYLWWTPREVGTYFGQCAELCGYSHAHMRLRAMVDSQQDFEAWSQRQKAPAVTPQPGSDAEKGQQLFLQRGCGGCHTINGTAAAGKSAPDLTHVGGRTTIAAGIMENNVENLKRWIGNPDQVKPGSLMPNLGLNDAELSQVAAYLMELK